MPYLSPGGRTPVAAGGRMIVSHAHARSIKQSSNGRCLSGEEDVSEPSAADGDGGLG